MRRRRQQLLHAIEIADAGSILEIEMRTAAGEKSRGERTAVSEARVHRFAGIPFDDCAAIEQQLQQFDLHARNLGMNARSSEAERGRMPCIRVRLRIDVRAGIEKQPHDGDDVRRRSLAKIFDAVRGHVVKQRRSMLAARPLPDQLRLFIEQAPKCVDVARDDRIRRLLKLRIRGAVVLQRVDMPRELRPTGKPMRTRDERLRVCQLVDIRRSDVPFHALDLIGRESRRPRAQRIRIAAGFDEILRQLFVVAEVRMGRKRKRV